MNLIKFQLTFGYLIKFQRFLIKLKNFKIYELKSFRYFYTILNKYFKMVKRSIFKNNENSQNVTRKFVFSFVYGKRAVFLNPCNISTNSREFLMLIRNTITIHKLMRSWKENFGN